MPLTAANLKYLGGIIVPKVASHDVTYLPNAYPTGGISADSLGMGGKPFSLDIERREIVQGTRYGRVSRMEMIEPALHTDGTPNSFPTAPFVGSATMVDVSGHSTTEPNPPWTNKTWYELTTPWDIANTSFGGCLVVGNKIIASGQVYYDANNIQRRSAFLADWPPPGPAVDYLPRRTPFRSIGDPNGQGLTSGYFCPIPEGPWRAALGGDMLMGQAALPIITRGSAGPCATVFRVADLETMDVVPTKLLVGYPNGHWMAQHPWDNPNADDVYNFATQITGCSILGDYIIFVGSHGYGVPCYGDGVSDPALADGVHTCYDPSSSAKANHAYPYRIQAWVYPLTQLADVAAGRAEPWDAVPDWFEIEVPFSQLGCQVNGCAYDPVQNRFYLSVWAADGYGYEPGPITYVFEYLSDAVTPPDPPDSPQDALKKAVAALTMALAAERQRHAATKAQVQVQAEQIEIANAQILALTNSHALNK